MKLRASFLLVGLLAVPAFAAGPGLSKFQQLDKNHDGKLTPDELPDQEWFKRLDLNGDGAVTLPEAIQFFAGVKLNIPNGPATAAGAATQAPPREAPRPLNPAECGIGSLVPDLPLRDVQKQELKLSTVAKGHAALVVASVSPTCPVAKRYLPTLSAMAAEYTKKNVAFLLLTGDAFDDGFRETLKTAGLEKVPVIDDASGDLRRALGATSQTDAFVLDAARTLIYRGAIDDQYGLGYSRDKAEARYLAEAIEAVLAEKLPRLAATEAPGCALDLGAAPATTKSEVPTYHGQIARIMQAHCVECHRTGGVAPFALETFDQVNAKAGMVRKMVDRGLMPPWFAAAPAKGEHSPWGNDRSLAERERTQLLAWLANGKPAGDPAEAPRPRHFAPEWQIGEPDKIVQIPTPIEVKATGTMPYQRVTVETGFETDKWVRGFEVRPTAREVVHHVIVRIVNDKAKGFDRGGFLAAYVPGNSSVVYPEGFAKQIPAGSKLQFEIHYTPTGTATKDQVRMGMIFAKEPPEHVVRIAEIVNGRINIPPNADNHEEKAQITVPTNVMLLGLMPHMHVRGKAFKYEADIPGGASKTLLEVPHYDFNWQLAYRYAQPLSLPAGTTLRASAWYDNSANNPANPDPNATVRWGQQTTDEMMLGYVEYCFAVPENPKITKAEGEKVGGGE